MNGFQLKTPPNELPNNLRTYLSRTTSKPQKRKILNAGGQVIRNVAKAQTVTVGEREVHYLYSKKAGKIAIHSGNLMRSINVFISKRGGLALIGPKILKSAPPEMGRTIKTSSGYYAAMIYGTAAKFRQAELEPALSIAQSAAVTAVQRKYAEVHKLVAK